MTSNLSSRIGILAVVAVLLASVATPVAAVSVASEDVPESAGAGEDVTATFELDELYQNPSFESWNLTGTTELEDVTWTVSFLNPSGETVAKQSYDGQSFETPAVSSNSDVDGDGDTETITKLTITVRGVAPEPTNFTYPEKETFEVANLVQTRGQSGSTNEIGTWEAHHYTMGDEETAGSRQGRDAIGQAEEAIATAEEAGGDVSEAESTLERAVEAYTSGQFDLAVDLANDAETKATDAKEKAESSQQTSQLLMFGGVGLIALLVIVGGVWYWRNQGDDYDKLG